MIVHCSNCKTIVAEGTSCPSCGQVNGASRASAFDGMPPPSAYRSSVKKGNYSATRSIVLGVVVVIAGVIGVKNEIGTPHGDPAKLQAALTNLQSAADGKLVSAQAAPQANATGDDDVLANVVNQMAVAANDVRRQRERIGAEMSALPLQQVLTPDHLSTAEGIQASRQTMVRYSELLDEFDASSKDYIQRVGSILQGLPPEHRAEAMAGFNAASGRLIQTLSDYVGTLRGMHDTISSLLDLMQGNLGRMQRRNGKIALPPDVLAQYRTSIERLQALARRSQQQEAQIAQLQQEGRQAVADLKAKVAQQ